MAGVVAGAAADVLGAVLAAIAGAELCLPLQAVIQVKNKSGFGTFGEGVAMDSATFGSRYLGFYLISVQKNGIISRFCRFILVREGGGIR